MREDYLLHEINHNMFHFQIKLLRMIYVFTTQKKKLYKREPSENEEKEEKRDKKKFFDSFFFSFHSTPKRF